MVHPSTPPIPPSPAVLIVDEDPDTREMYEHLLTLEGFRVFAARNATEGFSCAAESLPDVIVTELSNSVIDGFELLARLHRDGRTARVPVIVLSGWADPNTAARVRAAGAAGFLIKPCSPDVLLSEINRALHSPLASS